MRWTAAWIVVLVLLGPSCGEDSGRGDAPTPAWIDPALLSLPIELPHFAEIEGDDRSSVPAGDETWRSVAILADGTVLGLETADGRPRASWKMGADDPGVQDDAIQDLTKNLVEATASPELRFPDGMSRVRMLIYADWRTKWEYVLWIMQACAHPSVKIFRLSFALRGAGERPPLVRFDSDLPKYLGLMPTFPEDVFKIKIKVFRRDLSDPKNAHTMIKIDNDRMRYHLPKAWKGRTKELRERIDEYDGHVREIQARVKKKMLAHGSRAEEAEGVIVAPPPKGGAVPHGDVMEVLGVLRRAGVTSVLYEGAATPLNSMERAARRAARK